jgi:hypothetical protein
LISTLPGDWHSVPGPMLVQVGASDGPMGAAAATGASAIATAPAPAASNGVKQRFKVRIGLLLL